MNGDVGIPYRKTGPQTLGGWFALLLAAAGGVGLVLAAGWLVTR